MRCYLQTIFTLLLLPSFACAADAPATHIVWQASRIKGSPLPLPPFQQVRQFPGLTFDSPLALTSDPAGGRLWVVTRKAQIWSFTDRQDVAKADLFVDLRADFQKLQRHPSAQWAGSAFSIALHPSYPDVPVCWVTYTLGIGRGKEHLGDGTRLSRFNVDIDEDGVPRCDVASEKVVLTWRQGGHNGGALCFGPDGYLYISAGDSEVPSPPDPLNAGQNITNRLSTIMRIDVKPTGDEVLYSIPADNPFARLTDHRIQKTTSDDLRYHASEGLPEIWAYGFRNPWKMSFDRAGRLWVGDVGWELYEMVYNVQRGGNYGWSIVEGPQSVKPDGKRGPNPIQPPALSYSHSEGASITGGFVYHGHRFPELHDHYVFGDYETRRLWSTPVVAGTHGRPDTLGPLADLVDPFVRIVSLGEDNQNELLILDLDEGSIYGLERTQATQQSASFPVKLSDTGLFEDTIAQKPSQGVVPYEINEPMWTDGATARRYVAVPSEEPIRLLKQRKRRKNSSLRETLQFPQDSVLARTVTLRDDSGRDVLLETQILHFDGRHWVPYSYAWNHDQTDAELVPPEGREVRLDGYGEFAKRDHWTIHSQAECRRCHNAFAGEILGFTLPQLTRPTAKGNVEQVSHFRATGLLAGHVPQASPGEQTAGYSAMCSCEAKDASIDQRARSYLAANCSHCHQKGAGGTATIDLQFATPPDEMRILDSVPAQGTFQIPNAAIVVPGDPYRSVLLYRLASCSRGRMPHIGSQDVDVRGVRLIHDWITSMSAAAPGRSTAPSLDNTAAALDLVHRLDTQNLTTEERERLLKDARTAAPEIRNLFTRFQPAEFRHRHRTKIVATEILRRNGNADKGAALFASKQLQCSNCHRIGETGGRIGPTLDDVGKRLQPAEILAAIVFPSKKIDPKFAAWTAVTQTGKVHSGLLVERSETEVTLRTVRNENVKIRRANLEELIQQTTSLMPDRLINDLSDRQIADLIAFLSSQR